MNIKEDNHNYGIDLLRIVAMLMIVAHHFSLHSGISYDVNTIDGTIMSILALHGKTGVNIFVLITGLFSSGKIRKKKIGNLIGCTTFYSIQLTLFAILTGSAALSKKLLLKAAVPLLFGNSYWFIVTYLELYILIPVLDMVAQKLDERAYRKYLLLFACLLCVLPTVVSSVIQVNDLGYNSLVWFVYVYFLGTYLRKYTVRVNYSMFVAAGLILVQMVSCILIQCGFAEGFMRLVLECVIDSSLNAVFPLVIAVFLILGFQNIRISRRSKIIRLLGSTTFGVYLFHDNVNFRGWMWSTVYQLVSGIGLEGVAANAVLSVIAVFMMGNVFEICRKTVAKKIGELLQTKWQKSK